MHRKVIVGIGEVLWDLLPSGKALGGAPANFIYHAAQIGGPATRAEMVSRVGRDALGGEILERWKAFGLDGAYLSVDPAHPTGTVGVTVDPRGAPVFTIHAPAAWDSLAESAALDALAASADAVCFGTLGQRALQSRETIRGFLGKVRPGALRILDINLRAPFYSRDVVEESLALADVLKCNDAELPVLAGMFSIGGGEEEAARELVRRHRLKLLALTRGANGSVLYTPERAFAHAGYPAQVVDSVGAGDAFAAAIVVGMLRGLPADGLNDRANRLASYVCSQRGGMPVVPPEIRSLFL